MARSLLVTPDLSITEVDVDLENSLDQTSELLGGAPDDRLLVAFAESGKPSAAVYCSAARRAENPEPNPLASMGRQESETGDGRFISDPTRAILGPVIFIGEEGQDLTDEEVESIEDGIRAVENYKTDNPEEYKLWHDAVVNLTQAD